MEDTRSKDLDRFADTEETHTSESHGAMTRVSGRRCRWRTREGSLARHVPPTPRVEARMRCSARVRKGLESGAGGADCALGSVETLQEIIVTLLCLLSGR